MAVMEEETPDAERAACLIHLRRVMIKKQGVELSGEGGLTVEEEGMLAFVVGLDEGGGFTKDPFTVIMDLLLPLWSRLRKPLGGYAITGWEES